MATHAGSKRHADEISDDEELDFIEPYDCNNPANEPRPDSVVYKPVFQELVGLSRSIIETLRDTLKQSEYQNIITRGLSEEVSKCDKPAASDQTMFAISGDMAAGKSSVINSILSIGTIARKGAGGGSCTWVVQRFMKAFDGQTSPFAARVTFFTDDEIREIIASLFTRYYRASNTNAENEEGTDGEDLKSDNFTEIRTILDIFCAIFADQPEFSNNEEAQKYLSRAESETDAIIVAEMTNWACEVVSNELKGRDDCMIDASTPDVLLYLLQPFTYQLTGEEAEGQVSPWPLVKTVDFGMDHPLLNEGIVLVDAPGLSDSNSTRASNAVAHHKACTHKITVADIARAKDDKSLRDNLASSFSHRGTSGTVLVLTRGDDIDAETEVGGTIAEKKQERQLRDEIKALREEVKRIGKKRRSGSDEERDDLDDQMRNLREQIKVKGVEYDVMRIKMRNKSVLKALQEQYRDLTGDPRPLAAFVVGNESYKKHQAGHAADEKPLLSVRDTGVVALRSRIYTLPAEGRLNKALHLANVLLPSLMNFFDLYCSKTHFARKAEIIEVITAPAGPLSANIRATKKKMLAAVEKLVLSPLSQGEYNWTQDARALCRKWAKLYSKTHLPIMRKQGYKKGVAKKNVAEVCWNQELLDLSRLRIEDSFKHLQNDVWPILEEITQFIIASLAKARKSIRDDPQFNIMALQPFLDSFKLEVPIITDEVNKAMRKYRLALAEICQKATITQTDAYLVKAMMPIYDSTIKIKGRGAPAKRVEHFQSQVCRMGGVWSAVQDGIRKDCNDKSSALITDIDDVISGSFTNIVNKFNAMCEDNSVKSEEEKMLEAELRAKLGKALAQVKQIHDGPLREAADACKAYNSSVVS